MCKNKLIIAIPADRAEGAHGEKHKITKLQQLLKHNSPSDLMLSEYHCPWRREKGIETLFESPSFLSLLLCISQEELEAADEAGNQWS